MKKLLLLLLFCHLSSAVKHSLKFFQTASSGLPNFPEYVSVGVLDEVLLGSCNIEKEMVEPQQHWVTKALENDPQHKEWYTQRCFENAPNFFKYMINNLNQRFNQSGGVHVLQQLSGCEWDDETGEVIGFNQFGYDGEDFIALDLKTETWIAPKQQAVITKHRWDADIPRIKSIKIFLNQIFPGWLKMYLDVGKSSLMRTVPPSVSLLQKSPSSPVSCHATGFHPYRAMMFWRKDGEELQEDVDLGEILPNHDGSFQMTADLKLSSVAPEDWRRYDCVFQLSGLKEPIVTRLDKDVIRTNWVSPSQFPAGPVIGVVVGLLLLALCITGLFIMRRNNNGFRPANASESPSDKTSASD